jgi:hypothetical protein
MVYGLIGAGVLLVIVGGLYGAKYLRRKNAEKKRREALKRSAESLLPVLKRNLRKLESGDLGWRRLGHGKDIIHLTRLTPKEGSEKAEDFEILQQQYPEVGRKVERHDKSIWELRDAATKLAEAIQAPVRKQFEQDREPREGEPVVRNVPEDSWILILQGLINEGQFEAGLKGNLGTYWSQRESRFEEILSGYGGPHLRKLNEIKDELQENERELQSKLQKIAAVSGQRR